MTAKTWHFLLPGSGSHELNADLFGAPEVWNICIDGEAKSFHPSRSECIVNSDEMCFDGPDGCQLNIRRQGFNDFRLLVNGFMVEEFSTGNRETLRDLRHMPDGSYTIAPHFSLDAGPELQIVRMYRFTTLGTPNELQVVHEDWRFLGSPTDNSSRRTFQVIHNGDLVDQRKHNFNFGSFSASFQIRVQGDLKIDTAIQISFDYKKWMWCYTCHVNHICIPECWTKADGDRPCHVPEVLGASALSPGMPELPESPASDKNLEAEVSGALADVREPVATGCLPQGVSFDSAAGTYQATVKVRGKFVLLGEYATVDEAHRRYLEARAQIGE